MSAEDDALVAAALAALIKGVGPKEVRTPNMTVVAHDIGAVNRVMERRGIVTIPSICNLSGCRTAPNRSRYDMINTLQCNAGSVRTSEPDEIPDSGTDCGCS